MTDNHFDMLLVWDRLGSSVRIKPFGTAQVLDPATNVPVTVVQNGHSTSVVTADGTGRASFVAQQGLLKLISGGLVQLVTSPEAATQGAANAAAAQAAQAAAEKAAADAKLNATAATNTAVDAHLGGDATNLIATVAGKVSKGAMVYNVKDYGATGDGTTDDTTAILAAQSAAGFRPLYFPNGTYLCSATLTAQSIIGDNRQKTTLSYTGTGTAIGVPAAGVQTYHKRIEHMTIKGTGTGTGIELDTVSNGYFANLLVTGFTQGVWLRATAGTSAQSIYNTFIDVNAENSSGYAWRIEDVSNENRFISCRVNIAVRGFQIASGNRNVITSCSVENCSERGVSIPDTVPGQNVTRGNVIAFTRFEFNANNITISSGVGMTMVLANRFVSGTYTDNGTGTVLIDQNSGSVSAGRYTTATRPAAPVAGAQIYDTTLGKPVWWNGTAWKDAAGTTV